MTTFSIEQSYLQDVPNILALYLAVAAHEGGLARKPHEINADYVHNNWQASDARGLSLIARENNQPNGQIIGEIHAYQPVPSVFAHVWSDLTIAIHPNFQGHGIGRALFLELLSRVERDFPSILRVELMARESNQRAIALYESLGFKIEGRLQQHIKNSDGKLEAGFAMACLRFE